MSKFLNQEIKSLKITNIIENGNDIDGNLEITCENGEVYVSNNEGEKNSLLGLISKLAVEPSSPIGGNKIQLYVLSDNKLHGIDSSGTAIGIGGEGTGDVTLDEMQLKGIAYFSSSNGIASSDVNLKYDSGLETTNFKFHNDNTTNPPSGKIGFYKGSNGEIFGKDSTGAIVPFEMLKLTLRYLTDVGTKVDLSVIADGLNKKLIYNDGTVTYSVPYYSNVSQFSETTTYKIPLMLNGEVFNHNNLTYQDSTLKCVEISRLGEYVITKSSTTPSASNNQIALFNGNKIFGDGNFIFDNTANKRLTVTRITASTELKRGTQDVTTIGTGGVSDNIPYLNTSNSLTSDSNLKYTNQTLYSPYSWVTGSIKTYDDYIGRGSNLALQVYRSSNLGNVFELTSDSVTWNTPYLMQDNIKNAIKIGNDITPLGSDSISIGIEQKPLATRINIVAIGNNIEYPGSDTVSIGNGIMFTPIADDTEHSIGTGNDTIVNRPNDNVSCIDSTILTVVGSGGDTVGNKHIEGKNTFHINNATSGTIYTFPLVSNSVVTFEMKINLAETSNSIFAGFIIKGAIYVNNSGGISYLTTNNNSSFNDYDLIIATNNNYIKEIFANANYTKSYDINLDITSNYRLGINLTASTTVNTIAGVISYVESRW